jgi:hypothetical protein
MKLRVMMRMMGLGTSAYWVINYLFWFFLYLMFTIIFIFVGSVVSLPSGYKLGLFTRQDYRYFPFFSKMVSQNSQKAETGKYLSIFSCPQHTFRIFLSFHQPHYSLRYALGVSDSIVKNCPDRSNTLGNWNVCHCFYRVGKREFLQYRYDIYQSQDLHYHLAYMGLLSWLGRIQGICTTGVLMMQCNGV